MDKLICAGKNYLEHAQEMQDGIPEKPVLFLKPPSVLKRCPAWQQTLALTLPVQAQQEKQLNYECELIFLIQRDGYQMSVAEAEQALSHVSIGLDMTNRVLQRKAKDTGGPWEVGKIFPDAATVGPWITLSEVKIEDLSFQFALNGQLKQQGAFKDMRMKPAELLAYASQFFPICKGDMLYTGTPAGVGVVNKGDVGRLSLNECQYEVVF